MKATTKRKISIIAFFVLSIVILIGIIFFTDTERQHTLQGDSGSYKVNEIVEMQVGQKVKLQDINPKFKKYFIENSMDGYHVHAQDAYSLLVNKVEKGRSETRTVFVDENGYVNATTAGLYRLKYSLKCIKMRESNYGNGMIRFPETFTFENTILVSDNNWKDYEDFKAWKYDPYGKYILTEDIILDQAYAWGESHRYEKPFYGTLINPFGHTITIDHTKNHDYYPSIFKENHGIIDGLKIKLVTNAEYQNYFDTEYYGIVEENYGVLQNCSITGDLYVANKLTGIDLFERDESRTVIYPMHGFVRNNTANINVYTDGVIVGYNEDFYDFADVETEIRNTWRFENNTVSLACNYYTDIIGVRQRETNADTFATDKNGNSFVYANISKPVEQDRYNIHFRVQKQNFSIVNEPDSYATVNWEQRENSPLTVPFDYWKDVLWENEVGSEWLGLEVQYWLVNGEKRDRLDGLTVTDDMTIEPCVKWKETQWMSLASSVGQSGTTRYLTTIRNADNILNISPAGYAKDIVQFSGEMLFSILNDPRNVIPEKIVFNKNVRHSATVENVFTSNDLRYINGYREAGGKIEFEAGNEELQLIDGKMLCKDGGKTLAYYFLDKEQTSVVLHPQIENVENNAFGYVNGTFVKSIDFSNAKIITVGCITHCPNVEEFTFGKQFQIVGDYDKGNALKLFNLFVHHKDSKIKKITIDPANTEYECIDNTYIVRRSDNVLLVALPTLTGTVSVPDGITSAEETAFCGSDIEELIFPDSFTNFQSSALQNMEKLKKITFDNPERLQSFSGQSYFDGLVVPKLSEVVFGDNIKELNFDSSIFQTAKLTTVKLPKNLENIVSMFTYCDRFVYEGDNPNIIIDDGVLYFDEGEGDFSMLLMAYPQGKTNESYVVLDGTDCIDSYAFADHKSIQRVYFPKTVYQVFTCAFEKSSVKSVVIPRENTVSFATRAFNSSMIKNIVVDENTKLEVGYQAFYVCTQLTSFPYQNVTQIGQEAFARSGIEYFEFGGTTKISNISSSIGHFADSKIKKVVFNDDFTGDITNSMFANSAIEEVVLSNQTQMIQDSAFKGCLNLKSISLKNVTTVKRNAFAGSGLEFVSSDNLVSVESEAFKDCLSLKTVQFSEADAISNAVFEGCTELETVVLPKITTVASDTFKNCTKLASVKLNENLPVNIYSSAFENCTSLQTIKGTIGNIYAYAFMNCTALEELHFSDPVTNQNSFANTAFSGVMQAVSLYMDVSLGFAFEWYAPNNFTFYVREICMEKFTGIVSDPAQVIAYDFEKGEVVA